VTDQAFLFLANGSSCRLDAIPVHAMVDFIAAVTDSLAAGMRLSSWFAADPRGDGRLELFALLADDARNGLLVARSPVEGGSFPSISARFPQAQAFEREMAEEFGLVPEGHPWMKPLRYHPSWTGRDAWGRSPGAPIAPAVGDFYRVEGAEVHEVAVGPVHAGVIEPGHFRFQCHGEKVYHLEIALGFQHRGVERRLEGGPSRACLRIAETAAGDSTIAHGGAYCRVAEALSGGRSAVRADAIRGIALELERIANHVGDLGAFAGDTG
jgi:hypothetical protein